MQKKERLKWLGLCLFILVAIILWRYSSWLASCSNQCGLELFNPPELALAIRPFCIIDSFLSDNNGNPTNAFLVELLFLLAILFLTIYSSPPFCKTTRTEKAIQQNNIAVATVLMLFALMAFFYILKVKWNYIWRF
jgi:hypothetical protein